jgi:hypothetical protein
VSECDREASIMRRPWPSGGCCAIILSHLLLSFVLVCVLPSVNTRQLVLLIVLKDLQVCRNVTSFDCLLAVVQRVCINFWHHFFWTRTNFCHRIVDCVHLLPFAVFAIGTSFLLCTVYSSQLSYTALCVLGRLFTPRIGFKLPKHDINLIFKDLVSCHRKRFSFVPRTSRLEK